MTKNNCSPDPPVSSCCDGDETVERALSPRWITFLIIVGFVGVMVFDLSVSCQCRDVKGQKRSRVLFLCTFFAKKENAIRAYSELLFVAAAVVARSVVPRSKIAERRTWQPGEHLKNTCWHCLSHSCHAECFRERDVPESEYIFQKSFNWSNSKWLQHRHYQLLSRGGLTLCLQYWKKKIIDDLAHVQST